MVATVFELRSSAVAVSYYEKDGYYAKNDPEHRQASFWHGAAAGDLGLKAHVRPSVFEDVLEGRVPGTETRLGRMREGEHDHRPGWDLTFSAPKSVSLEGLVVGDRRVIRAHDDAVRATLDWVEAELLETRGWDPAARRRPRVRADGMVVAGFRHLTSRDHDPQLHTHCVLANMTRTASGEWRSVEPTRIRRSEKLIGAYYRNELARRLQAMGMAVTPRMVGRVPGFELAGYERPFLDAFSGRRREILAYIEEHGLAYTAENAQKAALRTRRRKRDVGVAELVPAWREHARELGLTRDKAVLTPHRPIDPVTRERVPVPGVAPPDLPANELRSLRRAPALPRLPRGAMASWGGRMPPAGPPVELSPEPELGVLEAVARAVAHVAERRTAIPEAEIRAVALGHAPGRYSLAEVDTAIARLVKGGELIEAERRGMDRAFVTERALRTERRVLAFMRAARGEGKALAAEDAVEARLAASRLTRGQKEAVRTVLLSDDRVIGVQGHAGSGKTTMLREVKALLGGTRIQGLAPSASAARVLQREAGVASRTLQYFLARFGDLSDADRLARARAEYEGSVLAVDEASMIDSARMESLLRIAERLGVARVALVGDTAQLRAVDAGQPFRLLQKAGMTTATMDQVLRQRDPELLAAVGHAREGAPGAAIEGLGGRVLEAPREALGEEAAKRWLALAPADRDDTLILAPTHAIRRRANEAVREGLAQEGVLHGRALEVDRLVDRRLTRAQASEIASYEPGDTVVFHRDVFGCRANDICIVTGREDGKVVLAHPDGGERRFRPSGNAAHYLGLYDTERIELRAGDRIRWTRNRKPTRPGFGYPGTPALLNGGEAEIVEIGYQRVRFRDGDGEFGLARGDPQLRHLDHAYCTTVHAAQGRTARGAIAVLDAAGAADRELFHVELSRVSHEFLLLTDDREALVELLESRPGIEDGALAALGLDLSDEPAVDAEEFAELAADWRALRDRAEEAETIPFHLPGYRQTMARAAAFAAVDNLPADMRGLVDGMLEEHRDHLARDREVRDLTDGIRDRWRRWPELGWAAAAQGCERHELPRYGPWREEGAALLAQAREMLGAGPSAGDGEQRRHPAMPEAGLAAAVEALQSVRLKDDAETFERVWPEVRERAARDNVPELLAEGYAEVAELGERLAAADGLDERQREGVAQWREVHAEQGALAEAVRSIPGRVAAWVERRAAELPLDGRGAADPAHPACRDWRAEGVELEAAALAMLQPGDAHAPYLKAMPETGQAPARGPGQAVREAAEAVREALRDDRALGFVRLAREASAGAEEREIETFYAPRYGEAIAAAREIAGRESDAADWQTGVRAGARELAAHWLRRHTRCESLRREIREWPERAAVMTAARPALDGSPDALKEWREEAEPLLDEARAMQAPKSGHAPHLGAMPEERESLVRARRGLDGALLNAEMAETKKLFEATEQSAERTGGIAFDAEGYGDLMERVRALHARPGLDDDLRGAMGRLIDRHGRWTDDRNRVDAFLDGAAEVVNAPDEPAQGADMPTARGRGSPVLDGRAGQVAIEARRLKEGIPQKELAAHLGAAGVGPDGIDERERKIRDRIAEENRARIAEAEREAERMRRAELARNAAERAREAREEKEGRRKRDRAARREPAAYPLPADTRRLMSDWNAHAGAAAEAGIHPFRAPGYDGLVERIGGHARETGAELPDPLDSVLRDHKPLGRAARAAEKIAPRIEACMERRDELLRRADKELRGDRPVVDLGPDHERWRREADRVADAARKLLANKRHASRLDELGEKAKIEVAVERLERAAVLDHLPARLATEWETVDKLERESDTHRFFLPEHKEACERMSEPMYDPRYMDDTAWHFVHDEIEIRRAMDNEAATLAATVKELEECAAERERAEARDLPVVRQEDYGRLRVRCLSAVVSAETILSRESEYALHFKADDKLKETLETVSAEFDRKRHAEAAEWNRIQNERLSVAREQEQEQHRDRSRDRGMSM